MIVVRFRKTNPDVTLPQYETKGASGCDVRAFLPEGPLVIPSGEWRLVSTGLCHLDMRYKSVLVLVWLLEMVLLA